MSKRAPVSEGTKREVETKATTLIDTALKPRYIQSPPEAPQFNYLVDLFTKWHGRYFYLAHVQNK